MKHFTEIYGGVSWTILQYFKGLMSELNHRTASKYKNEVEEILYQPSVSSSWWGFIAKNKTNKGYYTDTVLQRFQ